MEKREKRRERSWNSARSAQKHHLRVNHPSGVVDCMCEQSVWFFDKVGIQRHGCTKKRHGQPKIGFGTCHRGDSTRPTVKARGKWRKEVHRLRREGWDE